MAQWRSNQWRIGGNGEMAKINGESININVASCENVRLK